MMKTLLDPIQYKKWIEGVFSRAANIYGKKHSCFFDYFGARLVEQVNLFAGASVLDLATGRGAVLNPLARALGKNGSVIGTDISWQMIEETQLELQREGLSQITLIQMDAEELQFEKEQFDFIFCGFGFFFFPDLEKVFAECLRVLKPGGILAISTWGERYPCHRVFQGRLKDLGIQQPVTIHALDHKDKLIQAFQTAGFSSIQVIKDQLDHVYPSLEDWYQSLWTHGSRGVLEILSDHKVEQLKIQLFSDLSSFVKEDGLHETINAFYTIGKKLKSLP